MTIYQLLEASVSGDILEKEALQGHRPMEVWQVEEALQSLVAVVTRTNLQDRNLHWHNLILQIRQVCHLPKGPKGYVYFNDSLSCSIAKKS